MPKRSDTKCSLVAIVPAAGVGARAGTPGVANPVPKQYRPVAGKPMLRWTVEALLAEARIERVFVAISDNDDRAEAALAALPRTQSLYCGGDTRFQTVANALTLIEATGDDWVLV